MKLLDGFISFVFSLVILVLAIAVFLVTVGWTSDTFIIGILNAYVFNSAYYNVVLITSIVCILAALKTTVLHSCFKTKDTSPIMVETEHGNVEIAQETITNTVKSVAMKLSNVKDINAKMLKKRNGIKIIANISVLANSNIKTLTEELQTKVIEVIKETTGVKVLDVHVKVKNIYEKNSKVVNKPVEESNVTEKPEVRENIVEKEVVENQENTNEEIVENKEEKKEE